MSDDDKAVTTTTTTTTATAASTASSSNSTSTIDFAAIAPAAVFIDDIPAFVNKVGEQSIRQLEELHQKYSFLEKQYDSFLAKQHNAIPDLEKTLECVQLLASKKDEDGFKVQYELAETLYANATIDKPQKVLLWLGADTMVEYDIEEACGILSGQLDTSRAQIKKFNEILAYLQDQRNTTSVNVARVHNYTVGLKKQKK